MAKEIILISGRDPTEVIAGDMSWVRAHGRAALRAGYEPHIFCVGPRSGEINTEFGVVHRVASPFRPLRFPALPGHSPLIAAEIMRFLLKRQSPYLIHGFGSWAYIGGVVSRKLKKHGRRAIPVASSFSTMDHETRAKFHGVSADHGRLERGRYWLEYLWTRAVIRRYERRMYAGSHMTLVNYESVRRLIQESHGNVAPIRKMPYSSETAFQYENTPMSQPPPGIEALSAPDSPLIVSVSRHDPRKGLDALLRALARLKSRGAAFRACLVGGGLLLEAHQRLAERLELGESVLLTGCVPDSYHYLQHADIFVLPSLQEGSGSVSLLEALQAGAAIVASNVDGIPEDVTDGDSALLVEPGDADALSRALERALTDVELRSRLQRRARETFIEKFSAEAFTTALGALYTELGFEGERG